MGTKTLLAGGVLAGPLFVIAFLVEGATRADYDPVRHPVSSLALGDSGWTQVANFVVTGLLTLAFAAGMWRAPQPVGGATWGAWGPLLVAACAVGLLGAAIFPTDPISGYPPGTPGRLVSRSVAGAAHDRFSALYFLGLPAACLVFARRFSRCGDRRWALYSVATAVLFALAFVGAALGFGQVDGWVKVGGLSQRIALIAGEAWLTLLAVHVLAITGAPASLLSAPRSMST